MSLSFCKDEDAVYELKYQILSKRCAEVKKETDRIYERLLRCKRMLGKVLYERRALKEKLERDYRDRISHVEIPVFREEDFAYEMLISQKQACSSGHSDTASPNQSLLMSTSSSTVPLQSAMFDSGINSGSNSNVPSVNSGNRRIAKSKSSKKAIAAALSGNGGASTSSTPLPKRDPDAPRKPVNAYFIFCEKKRSYVQLLLSNEQSGGEVDRKEVTRRLGQMWGALTTDEKDVYFSEYRKDKMRYGMEMEEYAKLRPSGLEDLAEPFDRSLVASTSSFSSSNGPSKPKKPRKSKLKSDPSFNSAMIPSSASSPAMPLPSTSFNPIEDHAGLMPYSGAYDDMFTGHVMVKTEIHMPVGGGNFFAGQMMDTASSPSSLTPTLVDNCPNFDKLNPSPIEYAPQPPIFVTAGEDATDEVFLSSHHQIHVIESPGVVSTIANSSSGETSFEMHQPSSSGGFSSNMHSVAVPQLLFPMSHHHHHNTHQSGINEMPVP